MDIRDQFIEHGDFKAEVIAADFVEHGLLLDQVTIRPVGTFRRTYGRDILRAELEEGDFAHETSLEIEVSREGIYDMLPEGLFHQPDPRQKGQSVKDIVEQIRRTRREEEYARKFFLAIEKEFYRTRLRVEINERKALNGAAADPSAGGHFYERDIYLRIWSELEQIAPEYRPPIIQILPRVFSIIGNPDLTAHILFRVLGEKVELSSRTNDFLDMSETVTTTLGDCYLGYDAFAGSWCLSEVPAVEIKVGPLQFHKVTDFLDDGKAARVIRLVMELLLPAETEYTIRPLLSQGNDELILNAHAHCAVLGYSSRI
jgi:hypothetical protein